MFRFVVRRLSLPASHCIAPCDRWWPRLTGRVDSCTRRSPPHVLKAHVAFGRMLVDLMLFIPGSNPRNTDPSTVSPDLLSDPRRALGDAVRIRGGPGWIFEVMQAFLPCEMFREFHPGPPRRSVRGIAWCSICSFRPSTPRGVPDIACFRPEPLKAATAWFLLVFTRGVNQSEPVQESPAEARKDSGSTFLSSSRRQLITCRSESNVPILRATRSH